MNCSYNASWLCFHAMNGTDVSFGRTNFWQASKPWRRQQEEIGITLWRRQRWALLSHETLSTSGICNIKTNLFFVIVIISLNRFKIIYIPVSLWWYFLLINLLLIISFCQSHKNNYNVLESTYKWTYFVGKY